jgi:hypothetical protein
MNPRETLAAMLYRFADTRIHLANACRRLGLPEERVKRNLEEASRLVLEAKKLEEQIVPNTSKSNPLSQAF